MKHSTTPNSKSTVLALAFFFVMTLVGVTAAHAQNDTLNPLFSTTGPNVLGAGRIQWNSSLDYFHSSYVLYGSESTLLSNNFGATTGLRFGIGNRAELTLDVSGAYALLKTENYIGSVRNTQSYYPSVGVKLLLAEGKGWLPQVAYFTHVGMVISESAFNPTIKYIIVQPEIGLMFRNRVGRSCAIDYSLGYAWNSGSDPGIDFRNQVQYSLFFRKLVSERHTVGVGIGNNNSAHQFMGNIEWRYLVNPNLQLSLQAGGSLGLASDSYADRAHANLGIHWVLR